VENKFEMVDAAASMNCIKKCGRCGAIKALDCFNSDKSQKDGKSYCCRPCRKEIDNRWYLKHRESKKQYDNLWRASNRDKSNGYSKAWRSRNPDKAKEIIKKSNNKKRNDLGKKMSGYVSCRMRCSLKDGSKATRRWEDLVGYSTEQLKKHLEIKFMPGMTWENYNRYGWHIDHIIPISAFNFFTPDDIDFKRCWALGNLQPLWAKDNLSKHAKIDKPFQPSLAM
jgi:hypothetical protein